MIASNEVFFLCLGFVSGLIVSVIINLCLNCEIMKWTNNERKEEV